MKFLRFVARLFGWLLTPIVASAASFFGAVGGAMIAGSISNPMTGLITSAVSALIAAVVVTWFWLQFLRRRPEVRHVLGVDETGAPEAFIPEIEEAPTTSSEAAGRREGDAG
jgi:hypothetical protein